jgi:hypothetical protein
MNRLRFLLIIVWLDAALQFLVARSPTSLTGRCDAFVVTRNFSPSPGGRSRRSNNNPYPSPRRHNPLHSATAATSFESLLLDRLAQNDTSPITVQGYLLSKRSLGKGLVFADFHVDSDYYHQHECLCQAMMRREYLLQHNDNDDDDRDGDDNDDFAATRKQMFKGTKFQITGSAAPTRNPGNVVLLIHSLEFIGFPRQLQYIQLLLQQGQEGTLGWDQIFSAAGSPVLDSALHSKLLQLQSNNSDPVVDKKFLKQLARDILQALPDDPNYPEAADQVEFSKQGNFMVPSAPPEWQHVPPSLLALPISNPPQDPRRRRRRRWRGEAANVVSIAEALQQDTIDDDNSSISVMGWVQNRRRFDGNITLMALVDDYASLLSQDSSEVEQGFQGTTTTQRRLLAIVHPELVSPPVAGAYRNLAAVGSKVELHGRLILAKNQHAAPMTSSSSSFKSGGGGEETTNTPNNMILWVDSIRLEQSSSRSVTIRHLLDLLQQDGAELEREEVFNALLISSTDEADSLLTLDPTQRQWKANELAIRLQEAAAASTMGEASTAGSYSPRELLVDPRLLKVLEQYSYLTKTHPINATTLQEMEELLLLPESSRKTNTEQTRQQPQPQPQPASGMVRAPLPLGMPGTKWQHKKRPQLVWMGQQIREVLESHPDYGKRRLKILDIGGGKGSLAHYLGQSMQELVQVHVVDICEGAVVNGANKAEKLNLPVDFSLADASQALNVTADVVVALHACGHLSDVALAHALQRDAGFVIVPCCFNSNPQLKIPIQQDEREEQQVSVSEWLDLPSEDWSALKLLAEVQGDITLANEAIGVLCAIRAQAACDHVSKERVCIKRFPIEFSTRNTVLVGRCR